MSWQEFSALLVLATAMSFSPGPNTTLSTALAANRGLRGALHFVCAVPVGWGALLLVCAFGVGTLVLALPMLHLAIKTLGIGYLLWLAWQLAHAGRLGEVSAEQLNVSFWQGAALQFVNIKAWMLALTLMGTWVSGHANMGERLAIVVPVMLAYAFASNFSYALMGALLRRWLAQGTRLLWFNRGMAAVLVATAAWMVQT